VGARGADERSSNDGRWRPLAADGCARVGGQTGYVPTAVPGDSAHPNLRLQHNGSTREYHNRVGPGSAIPDSVVHQYRKSDFTTSNWPDSIGGSDITTVSAPVFDSSAFNNDGGVTSDGADDFAQSDTMGNFGSNLDSNLALSIPFETSAGGDNTILGVQNNNGSTAFVLYANGASFATEISNLGLQLVDDATNNIRVSTDSAFADGNPHHLIINKTATTLPGIEFYVDDMTNPVATSGRDDGLGTFGDFELPMTYFARNQRGNIKNYYGGAVGTPRWFDSDLSESERQTVHDDLGWT